MDEQWGIKQRKTKNGGGEQTESISPKTKEQQMHYLSSSDIYWVHSFTVIILDQ